MSDLLVTSLPENFRSRRRMTTLPGDTYRVCERIAEKYPRLIVTLKDDGSGEPYVVSEHCADGVIRFVARYKALDSSIIEDLDYMQRVPYAHRVRESEARAEKRNAELGKPDPEKQEKWMAEFRQDLIRAGFVHGAETWDSAKRRKGRRKAAGLNG